MQDKVVDFVRRYKYAVIAVLLLMVAGILTGGDDGRPAPTVVSTHSPSMLLCDLHARYDEPYGGADSDKSKTDVSMDRSPVVLADGSWRWGFIVVRSEHVFQLSGTTEIANGWAPTRYRGYCVGNTNSESVSVKDVELLSRHIVETTCLGSFCSQSEKEIVYNTPVRTEDDGKPAPYVHYCARCGVHDHRPAFCETDPMTDEEFDKRCGKD